MRGNRNKRRRLGWSGVLFVIAFVFLNTTSDLHALPAVKAIRVVPSAVPNPTPTPLPQAVFATAPPGDYNRLFIVRQSGQIHILNLVTGVVNPTPFLDIHTGIRSGGEQGLLGMAFDPDYFTEGSDGKGKFYLNFTVPGGVWGNGVTHISQFQVSNNPDVADPTEKLLTMVQPTPSPAKPLTFDHPQSNHNGGWIGFSSRPNDDHNLYVATGDGGNHDDVDPSPAPVPPGHIEPGGNAQNNTTLLGKMLRVHVEPKTATYTIPPDNPLAVSNPPVRKEVWTLGLRNPYRDSFDRLTGRMFIGDVGQGSREEVDVQQPGNPGGGENYGWRDREGFIQNPFFPKATPTPTPIPPRVNPILDYDRNTGGTVIGGYVYRGNQIPGLRGTYVFGDYLAQKIFALNYDGTTASNFQDITSQFFSASTGFSLNSLSSFAEDANGELYITDVGNGNVYKIVPVTPNVEIDSITRDLTNPMVPQIIIRGLGVPFTNVTIQATSDLTQQFAFLTTVPVAGDGTFEFSDTTNPAVRFYRVKYP